MKRANQHMYVSCGLRGARERIRILGLGVSGLGEEKARHTGVAEMVSGVLESGSGAEVEGVDLGAARCSLMNRRCMSIFAEEQLKYHSQKLRTPPSTSLTAYSLFDMTIRDY